MIFASPGNVNRKRKPVMANFTDNRKVQLTNDHLAHLKSLSTSPISYLVEEINSESTFVHTPFGQQVVGSGLSYHANLMESLYGPRKEVGCGDTAMPVDFQLSVESSKKLAENCNHWQDLSIHIDKSREIEQRTRSQAGSSEWFDERRPRLTASKFGPIMTRKKSVNESFLRNTFFQEQFVSKPTTYELLNEKTAKVMYVKQTGNHLHDVGLVKNPKYPFLGASPDAVVCDDGLVGLLEVKSPYSARKYTLQESINHNIKDFCLKRHGDNIVLDETHKHFFQVQGQLLVTGLHFCDFVVYFQDGIFVQRIQPDLNIMESLLNRLCDFYVQHFKPYYNQCK